jgi:hypothetical protein
MPENPYNAPQAELQVRKSKLLRTVATGALWGMALGIAYDAFVLYHAIYDQGLEVQFILLPRMLFALLLMHVLPLTVFGGIIALAIGVVRKIISR